MHIILARKKLEERDHLKDRGVDGKTVVNGFYSVTGACGMDLPASR
jgi:hypothetical protein